MILDSYFGWYKSKTYIFKLSIISFFKPSSSFSIEANVACMKERVKVEECIEAVAFWKMCKVTNGKSVISLHRHICVSYILNAHLMSISLVAVWNAVLLHKCGQRYKRKRNTSASEQATYNWENRLLFATSTAHNTIKVSASLCAGNIKSSGKSEMLETLILL